MTVDNKLFLVAIPRGKMLSVAQAIQTKLNEKYNIYDPNKLPPLHVTIDHITVHDEQEYSKAVKIISDICKKKAPFELTVNGFSFFETPHKSINLYVEKTQCLQDLSIGIHESLKKEGLSSRPFYHDWEFHISLINTVFSAHDWSKEVFLQAKELVQEWKVDLTCQVEWLELWKPKYQPQLEIEEFFKLSGENGLVESKE